MKVTSKILASLAFMSLSTVSLAGIKGHLKGLSANDTMHFSFYSNKQVTAGHSDELDAKRSPYNYKIAEGYSLDDVIAFSANDKMHFAWYRDGRVSAGVSDNLVRSRKPYRFSLAPGYTIDDLITISSNDRMHFAWYKDGKVSAGVSDDLDRFRAPKRFSLAPGYGVKDLVDISSNNRMHFAFYKDGTVSAGASDDIDRFRAPYDYRLASGFSLAQLLVSDAQIEYEDIDFSGETSSDILVTQTFINDSSATLTQSFSASETFTDSFELSFNQQLTIGTEFTIEAGVPFFGKGEATSRFELSVGSEQVSSSEESKTFEIFQNVEIPPFTSVQVTFGADFVENLEVPFTMSLVYRGNISGKALSSKEIIEQLDIGGFEGRIVKESPGKVEVEIDGIFRGSFGLKTFFFASEL